MSAIGLHEQERELWPYLRERLRRPGRLMALMRGVLGDAEVAVVTAVTPEGAVEIVAVLTTQAMIAEELRMVGPETAMVGDYEVQVVTDLGPDRGPRPIAILTTPWIEQHLLLYARTLWHRRKTSR